MSRPDFEKAQERNAGRFDDDALRALEAEVDRALERMSEQEFEYWIGGLVRMLEEAGSRFH